jgi:histidinol-phosphate phosphatase family protein
MSNELENNQGSNKHKAIFIDRDGVINYNRNDYVKSWNEFRFIPGAKEAIKRINDSKILLIVITNQSPIGRGIFPTSTLHEIHTKMLNELNKAGARIDAIYYCPHHPEDNCDCRKPKPGLILRAAHDFYIDLKNSWMVGDSDTDLEAGSAAGCKTIKVTDEKPLLEIINQILNMNN